MASTRTAGRITPAGITGRQIRFRTSLHNSIYDVMQSKNWLETERYIHLPSLGANRPSETDWDFFWADVGWIHNFFDQTRFTENQRVNHFRNHYELTRKDLLVKNLKRMRKKLDREGNTEESKFYNFLPNTYVVPSEYALFLEEFKRQPGSVYIMKPIAKAQGKGIFLFTKLNQISEWKRDSRWSADAQQAETYIAQRYVDRPLLIGGRKFDMRIYVLVTSYMPLTVWLYRSGFGRFTNTPYDMDPENLENTFVHLTNVAVQKTAETYDKSIGCKWYLDDLKLYLIANYGQVAANKAFYDIQCMIIRTLLSVQGTMIQDRHCFELYGYDVLFDDDLKPWLIEVNASPSLTAETEDDYTLKWGLLYDTVAIIDMEKKLSGNETQVGGFDLVYHSGMTRVRDGSSVGSMLGCFNDRLDNLKKLDRDIAARQKQKDVKE